MWAIRIVVPPVPLDCWDPARPPQAASRPDVEATTPAAAAPRRKSRLRNPAVVGGMRMTPPFGLRRDQVPRDASDGADRVAVGPAGFCAGGRGQGAGAPAPTPIRSIRPPHAQFRG